MLVLLKAQSKRYELDYHTQEKMALLEGERRLFGEIPVLSGNNRAKAIWALCQIRQELWDKFRVKAPCSLQEAIR